MAKGEQKIFKTRIQLKRDTSSNWEANNPKLLNGEMILVDTASGDLRTKIGDGQKTYSQLPFTDEGGINAVNTHNTDPNAHKNMHWVKTIEGQTVTGKIRNNASTLDWHTSDYFLPQTHNTDVKAHEDMHWIKSYKNVSTDLI